MKQLKTIAIAVSLAVGLMVISGCNCDIFKTHNFGFNSDIERGSFI
jgi:hypothetical protein